jgi:hypothetical protein
MPAHPLDAADLRRSLTLYMLVVGLGGAEIGIVFMSSAALALSWLAGWLGWRAIRWVYRARTRTDREERERLAHNRSTRSQAREAPGVLARLPGCVLLGGYGHGLTEGAPYDVTFGEQGASLRGEWDGDDCLVPLHRIARAPRPRAADR